MNEFLLTQEEIAALRSIGRKFYGASKARGWHDKPREIGTRIALAHSELSEALEGFRKDKMDDHLPNRKNAEVEIGDCIIRLFDTAETEGFDLASAIAEKHEYNLTREDHSLEARAKEGGKSF